MDSLDKFKRFENGMMDAEEFLQFFSELIQKGIVWKLGGIYKETASDLIEKDIINDKGRILATLEEEEEEEEQ